jgi:hypothetical protein
VCLVLLLSDLYVRAYVYRATYRIFCCCFSFSYRGARLSTRLEMKGAALFLFPSRRQGVR